jgi:hypothetical protein
MLAPNEGKMQIRRWGRQAPTSCGDARMTLGLAGEAFCGPAGQKGR